MLFPLVSQHAMPEDTSGALVSPLMHESGIWELCSSSRKASLLFLASVDEATASFKSPDPPSYFLYR